MAAALPLAAVVVLALAAGCARSRGRTWAQFSPIIKPIEIEPYTGLSLGAAGEVPRHHLDDPGGGHDRIAAPAAWLCDE